MLLPFALLFNEQTHILLLQLLSSCVVDSFPIFYNYITSVHVCVCFSESYFCFSNFNYYVRSSDMFSNFTLFVSSFLFSLITFFSLFPRCFSRSVSPLLRCANIIKLSRLYYTAMLHFYFVTPSVLHLQSTCFQIFSRFLLFYRLVSHLYAASR